MTNWLFSYGSLQLAPVQIAKFGRLLESVPDRLHGWRVDKIEIADPAVVELSGQRIHSILRRTGDAKDCVDGVRLQLSDAELAAADEYEVADYCRIGVELASGTQSYVYVTRQDAATE